MTPKRTRPRSPAAGPATQEPATPPPPGIARRRFLRGTLRSVLGAAGLFGLARPAPAKSGAGGFTKSLLEDSEFAYISPLLGGGEQRRESSCHAELWYGWIDNSVIVNVSRSGWKSRAVGRGLTSARVWIGNHGRWRTRWSAFIGGLNEAFREAPHFDAIVEEIPKSEAPAMLEQTLRLYRKKYPAEIADWEGRMRSGIADGSRVLLRYRPPTDLLTAVKSPAEH